jgi:hypothetical protein
MIFQPFYPTVAGRVSGAIPLSLAVARCITGFAARSVSVAANLRTDVLQRSNRGHGGGLIYSSFYQAPLASPPHVDTSAGFAKCCALDFGSREPCRGTTHDGIKL